MNPKLDYEIKQATTGLERIAQTFHRSWEAGAALVALSVIKEASSLARDAARYRWLRDKSEPGICSFYLSVGQAFKNVKFAPETVDEAIDAAIQRKGQP